jgi:hypothetical protein
MLTILSVARYVIRSLTTVRDIHPDKIHFANESKQKNQELDIQVTAERKLVVLFGLENVHA